MSERIRMLNDYRSGEFGIQELADSYGISRKSVYKWVERFEAGGWEALADRSRAPHHHPNAVDEAVEMEILKLKARWRLWGAPKLRVKLLARVGPECCPAESTISEILKRHGLSRKRGRGRRAVWSQRPLEHCLGPNQVWCADFKGWFRTGDRRKCSPLTISDAYSRYLLCCQGLAAQTGFVTVQPLFERTFREYGLPEAIRTDNGTPFASTGLGGLTPLSIWWLRLGIRLERIEPGKPQQNGRHERMHRTLDEATEQPPRRTGGQQQAAFDEFRHEYNEERPHESLNQQTPATVYQPSARSYPARLPPEPEYPDGWEKRRICAGGQMRWRGQKIFVGRMLAGQLLGLEPVREGQWLVYFTTLSLGLFDEKSGRIERLKKLESFQRN